MCHKQRSEAISLNKTYPFGKGEAILPAERFDSRNFFRSLPERSEGSLNAICSAFKNAFVKLKIILYLNNVLLNKN